MSHETKRWRSVATFFAGVALGLLLAGAGVYAHLTGTLGPLYHRLGWHQWAHHDSQELPASMPKEHAGHAGHEEPPGHAGHEGHGGMAAPAGMPTPATVPGYSVVTLSPERRQLIGVRTGKVEKDKLVMSIRTVGIIEPDQTRLARLHTRVSGWVTKVHANFVGQDVKKTDPLLELYSPDLLATQREYLITRARTGESPIADMEKGLLESARRRLALWGVPEDEIQAMEKTGVARETLRLRSPIAGRILERNVLEGAYVEPATELYRIADLRVVWLQAKIYEHELPHVELGQPVTVTLPARPGEELTGKVSFVEPVLQETTRTVKVRVEIANPKGLLMPGMYADVRFDHDMGEGLLIPESAVLRTGARAMAFRTLPEGHFEPVEVELGGRFGERFEVKGGLEEGDEVVVSGNFLIDSESRLKAATSAMGHHH